MIVFLKKRYDGFLSCLFGNTYRIYIMQTSHLFKTTQCCWSFLDASHTLRRGEGRRVVSGVCVWEREQKRARSTRAHHASGNGDDDARTKNHSNTVSISRTCTLKKQHRVRLQHARNKLLCWINNSSICAMRRSTQGCSSWPISKCCNATRVALLPFCKLTITSLYQTHMTSPLSLVLFTIHTYHLNFVACHTCRNRLILKTIKGMYVCMHIASSSTTHREDFHGGTRGGVWTIDFCVSASPAVCATGSNVSFVPRV